MRTITGRPPRAGRTPHVRQHVLTVTALAALVVVGAADSRPLWALVTTLLTGGLLVAAARNQRVAAELRGSAQRFRTLVQESSDVVMVIGDARVTYASPSIARVLGYADEQVLDRRYLDMVHPDDRGTVVAFVTALVDQPGGSGLIECRLRHADGRWIPFESSCRNLLHDPGVAGFVITGRDVTERKALEAQLEHRALHDALTGLPNRVLFHDHIDRAIARAQRTDERFAVLYLDLDGFKTVNDTRGHAAGDAVLAEVARRVTASLRGADVAARLGGDEFAILVQDVGDGRAAARVARRILASLRVPIDVAGAEVVVGGSVGIAVHEPGSTGEQVLRDADIAMYRAKRAGKGCIRHDDRPSRSLAMQRQPGHAHGAGPRRRAPGTATASAS